MTRILVAIVAALSIGCSRDRSVTDRVPCGSEYRDWLPLERRVEIARQCGHAIGIGAKK